MLWLSLAGIRLKLGESDDLALDAAGSEDDLCPAEAAGTVAVDAGVSHWRSRTCFRYMIDS
jgi:hypothetical protein